MLIKPKDFLKKCNELNFGTEFINQSMLAMSTDSSLLVKLASANKKLYFTIDNEENMLVLSAYNSSDIILKNDNLHIEAFSLIKEIAN